MVRLTRRLAAGLAGPRGGGVVVASCPMGRLARVAAPFAVLPVAWRRAWPGHAAVASSFPPRHAAARPVQAEELEFAR